MGNLSCFTLLKLRHNNATMGGQAPWPPFLDLHWSVLLHSAKQAYSNVCPKLAVVNMVTILVAVPLLVIVSSSSHFSHEWLSLDFWFSLGQTNSSVAPNFLP